jgi:hypothetical protein
MITIDGKLDEPSWQQAPWTNLFVDIEGDLKPKPRFATRAKMLWDDDYFYIGADLEEPDVWATLTQRDAVICMDNDFEVFIDPDGDTHEYYEFEINALNTGWDLLLVKPYRDGGPAVIAWDIAGLKTAVDVRGTLNKPGDRDEGWSVEMAFPWKVLNECAHRSVPPESGDQWRVDFSRVEWQIDVVDGKYQKRPGLREDNWVWSPQGLINMHYPEMWGYVQFSTKVVGTGEDTFIEHPAEEVKWILRRIYYAEQGYRETNGRYTNDIHALGLNPPLSPSLLQSLKVEVTDSMFEAVIADTSGRWHIRNDSKVWRE